jgi:hypothetical protein
LELYERNVVKHITTKNQNQSKYDLAVGSASYQYLEAEKRPPTAAMITFVVFTQLRFQILLTYGKVMYSTLKKVLEPISKIRLEFRARRETVKKRSIHVVCEHFEPFRNAAMGT